MRELRLTRGYITVVDDDDFDHVNQFKWFANIGKSGRVYASRRTYLGGGRENQKRGIIYLHRFLMNPAKDMDVDHKNGDPLDNRRSNLRICSRSDNILNAERSRNGGVWLCKQTKRWGAQFRARKKRYFLGRFNTEPEARAAIKAAKRVLGVKNTIPDAPARTVRKDSQ